MTRVKLPDRQRVMFGGDPELFLLDKTDHIAPIHTLELEKQGVKRPTYQRSEMFEPFGWTRDGCAVELHPQPFMCKDVGLFDVQNNLHRLSEFAAKHGLHLSVNARERILSKDLEGAPDDMTVGGCAPDIDGYTGRWKSPAAYLTGYRYTGGHMHMQVGQRKNTGKLITDPSGRQVYEIVHSGLDHLTETDLIDLYAPLAQLCDIWIGIPLVAVLGRTHGLGEANRRQYYGQAGSFRVQPHGFEYRVPSGRLLLSGTLWHAMYGFMRLVGRSYFQSNGESVDPVVKTGGAEHLRFYDPQIVQNVINTHDYVTAQAMCLTELMPALGIDRDDDYSTEFGPIAGAMGAMILSEQMGKPFLLEKKSVMAHWDRTSGPSTALNGNSILQGWYEQLVKRGDALSAV